LNLKILDESKTVPNKSFNIQLFESESNIKKIRGVKTPFTHTNVPHELRGSPLRAAARRNLCVSL
jgi:hypothetical protein